jgi:hypothetical protein
MKQNQNLQESQKKTFLKKNTMLSDEVFNAELQRRIQLDLQRQVNVNKTDYEHEQDCKTKQQQRLKTLNTQVDVMIAELPTPIKTHYKNALHQVNQEIAKKEYETCLDSLPGFKQRAHNHEIAMENAFPNGYGPHSPKKKSKGYRQFKREYK